MSNRISVRSHRILLTRSLSTFLICSLLQLFVLMSFASVTRAQGFSDLKLELYPRTPARIPLDGTNLTLKFESQASIGYDQLQRASKSLEDFLKRRIPVSGAPDAAKFEINFTVADLNALQKNVTLWKSEYRRTGSRMETDPTTNMPKTVDDYDWVKVSYNGIAVDARIVVKYELKDSITGIILDAETINTGYYQEYDTYNVPDINTVHQGLLAKATTEIGMRLTSRAFEVQVLLSKGKLKDVSSLLVKRSWAEAQRLLESMPRFSKNKDEAFRLYLLGIVNEAIAYDASSLTSARRHLDMAAKYHAEARAMKPDQFEFWWSEGRASDLAWKYGNAEAKAAAFEDARKDVIAGRIALEEAVRRVQSAGNSPSPTNALGSGLEPLSNEAIIGWIKAGVPEKVIKATIKRTATNSKYDLSAAGIADLKRAGASESVIKEMTFSQYPYRAYRSFKIMTIATTVAMVALPLLFIPMLK